VCPQECGKKEKEKESAGGGNMGNRITVGICGGEYTLLAEESPSYMQKVAALVDAKMSEIMASGHVSRMDAAVLAAANMADEMLKQQGSTELMRSQLKDYLEETNRLKNELSECKRENFKLQQRLDKLQKQH